MLPRQLAGYHGPSGEFPAREAGCVFEKSARLLAFGVKKVMSDHHAHAQAVRRGVQRPLDHNWTADVPVPGACVLSPARLPEKERRAEGRIGLPRNQTGEQPR